VTFGALNNEVVGSHTRNEWLQQLEDQGHMCFWCGRPICDGDMADEAGVKLEKDQRAFPDHLVPINRKGVDFIWNVVAACKPCNDVKHDRLPGEFLRDRLAFAKPPVEKKKIYTTVPLTKGRDESGQVVVTSHLEVSDLGAQLIRNLAAKLPTIEHSDEWYAQRRKALAQQVVALSTRLLESAGQMQLSLNMPSSVSKPPQSDGATTSRSAMERKA
jgi:HNH endonuclease